jgi:hypothetical protein
VIRDERGQADVGGERGGEEDEGEDGAFHEYQRNCIGGHAIRANSDSFASSSA